MGRYGTKPSLLFSGVLMTCAAVGLTLVRPDTPIWQLILTFTVFGIGFGAVNAPITTTAVSGMPLDRAGAASAVASTSRQVGISLGVALCGALTGAGLWWTIAGFATAVIALGVAANTDWAYRSRDRIAPCWNRRSPHMPDDMPTPDDVWQQLTHLVMDTRDSWKRAVSERIGMPFSRFRVLRRLLAGPLTPKQLSAATSMDAPATTVTINDLEERGLVIREIDPTNRRSKLVSITDAGRDIVADAFATPDPAPAELTALNPADLRTLHEILRKLEH